MKTFFALPRPDGPIRMATIGIVVFGIGVFGTGWVLARPAVSDQCTFDQVDATSNPIRTG
jgi:hypothetical protein